MREKPSVGKQSAAFSIVVIKVHFCSMGWGQVKLLLQNEMRLEWRAKYALGGVLLHALASVFTTMLCVHSLKGLPWAALLWIILLFSTVSAVARAFIQESRGRMLYYYGISRPTDLIFAKVIYNGLLATGLFLLTSFVYAIVLSNPVAQPWVLLPTMAMSAFALATVFTMMSAIAAKSGNASLVMPILSIPLVIPVLLIGIQLTVKTFQPATTIPWVDLGVLVLFNGLLLALAYILFPFLWKE